jgi:hypothetical protein
MYLFYIKLTVTWQTHLYQNHRHMTSQ